MGLNLIEETNKEFLCKKFMIKPRAEFDAFCDWSDIVETRKLIKEALKTSRSAKKRMFSNFA